MVVNYAKNFIKEYDVKKIDIYTLKTIISKLGYKLVEYSPLFNSEHVNTLVKGLDLKSELRSKSCFTYKSKLASYIFVRDSLEEHELIYLLLHEIGHIYMHHIEKNTTDKSDYYEHKANKFADDVKYYVNQNRLKRKALYIVPTFLISTLIVAVVALNFKGNKSEVYYYQEPSVTTTEQTTEPITETVTEIITTEPTAKEPTESITEHSEGSETLYYVSSSGRKYHLKDCYQINPDNCTALPLKQIVEMGYTPCKTCKPDKQD